jgi:DNA invertase Pin-like site-specific DNA recombinase
MRDADNFFVEYCNRYNGRKGLNDLQRHVKEIDIQIITSIDYLDQDTRDILQLVS